MTTLGVYIEVPFCRSKCTYCNFSSNVFSQSIYGPYIRAVAREIASARDLYSTAGLEPEVLDLAVDTVYIGGGTPSLLAPALLENLFAALRLNLSADRLEEVTLEASPASVSPEKALAWRRLGVNRLSLGVQSLNDAELRAVGRLDRRADAFAAVGTARHAGFENISVDMILGLPGQTEESWRATLAGLEPLAPEHVSLYMLEVDDGSRLGREVLAGGARYGAACIPNEDALADWYDIGRERLAALGYEQYEISNFARPDFASRHNLKYWTHQPYVGFGAGAHSFNGRERWANVSDPEGYIRLIETGGSPRATRQRLTDEELVQEEFFLGLRTQAGVDVGALRDRYSQTGEYEKTAERFESLGLLSRREGRLRLSPAAYSVANEVLAEFVR